MARLRVTRSNTRSDLEGAARDEFLQSLAGWLVGFLCLAIGTYLIVAWFLAPGAAITIPLPGTAAGLDLHAGLTGALVAFLGVTVIWITQPAIVD